MAEYNVQLVSIAYIYGTVYGIEADSMEAAKAVALAGYVEASWPIDDTGDTIVPAPDRIAVVYVRNSDTREERYLDEEPPTRAGDVAGKMLATLRRITLHAKQAMADPRFAKDEAHEIAEQADAAIAAAEAAGITAEGR